ncbi:MAG: C45 family autoproteolytic acyltransferase/hydrolase [Candidatus Thorarchaeota archaeon]
MYAPPIYEPGNCSHIAVLPSATDTKHTYVARSYEFNQDLNDFRLCTVRIKGKPKTIRFSDFTVFRDDGMNSHGFSVTLSGGGILKKKPSKKGFPFFLIVRALLDSCKTVDEAVEYLRRVPVNGFWNFIVTDKNGNAALAQFFEGEVSIKQIDSDSPEPFLFVNNHYVLPDMVKYNGYAGAWILANSTKRFEVIGSTLRQANPSITKETLRDLLSKEVYEGLAGHYYTDYFGTLFSFIYDLTELKADVCFGTPLHNDWQPTQTLDKPKGVKLYESVFPDKSITHDDLWTE